MKGCVSRCAALIPPWWGWRVMGAQMFWRHGSTHFAVKSKRWNVESRSERQGSGAQVTTGSVSTQKTNCSCQAALHINPSLHTARPLSPLKRERRCESERYCCTSLFPSPPRRWSVLMSARSAHPGPGTDVQHSRLRSRPGKRTLHCLSWMRGRENGEARRQMFRHVLVF